MEKNIKEAFVKYYKFTNNNIDTEPSSELLNSLTHLFQKRAGRKIYNETFIFKYRGTAEFSGKTGNRF